MMGQCFEPPTLPAEIEHLPPSIQDLADQLNQGKKRIFAMIFANLRLADNEQNGGGGQQQMQQQQLLMIHGEAGSGKTFLYNKICEAANILVGTICLNLKIECK